MNSPNNIHIKVISEYKENSEKFIEAFKNLCDLVNSSIAKSGLTIESAHYAKNIYLLKLSYLELQKKYFEKMAEDLKELKIEAVISVLKEQLESNITSTLNDLADVNKAFT